MTILGGVKLCCMKYCLPKDFTTGQRWVTRNYCCCCNAPYTKTKPQDDVMHIFAFENWLEGNQDVNYCQVKYNATEKKKREDAVNLKSLQN